MTAPPSGWQLLPLGEVADTALGKMLDKSRDTGRARVPYLRNLNVQWGQIDTEDVATVELSKPELLRFALQPGDLLVCEGGEIGRAALWSGSGYMAYQKALHRVRPRPNLDARFLRYLLEHLHLTGYLASVATGSTIKHLPQERLRVLPVPTPPIEEQRRIVDILEDHLSRLDAGDRQLQSIETKVAAWRRAIIDEAIWTKDYPTRSIAELLREPMRNGHSARASASGNGVRTLTLTAVTRGDFSDIFTKIASADPSRVSDLWLRSGDILVQRANTAELVGTTALYVGPEDWAIFPDLLIRLRVDDSLASPGYVATAVRSERAHRWLRARAKGLAGSMPKIDQGTIGALPIPMPSRDAQRRLVAALGDIDTAEVRMRGSAAQAVRESAGLRRSLLAAAFSGRLTADRNGSDQIEELTGV